MGSRASKYKLGPRAVKYDLGARTGKYKLGVRVGKHKLGVRVGKHKLGFRTPTIAPNLYLPLQDKILLLLPQLLALQSCAEYIGNIPIELLDTDTYVNSS